MNYTHACIIDGERVAIGKLIREGSYGRWFEVHGESGRFIAHERDLESLEARARRLSARKVMQ